MPQLVLLNGPPGIGKSTIAAMFVDERPLALNLEVDVVRGLLGRWRYSHHEAGLLARRLAVVMAREALDAGHDVIVPLFVAQPEFAALLQATAEAAGAAFCEVVLLDTKDGALGRFHERTRTSPLAAHQDAAEMLTRMGGPETLARMYDRLLAHIEERPHAVLIDSHTDEPGKALQAFLAAISGSGPADVPGDGSPPPTRTRS